MNTVSDTSFRLQLFSNPELRSADGESLLSAGKPLALLIYLAVTKDPVSRDDLATLLWPEADHLHGRASVRQALWSLRRVLNGDGFVADDPVSLSDDLLRVDLDEFREALANGDVERAEELWKGPPLLGMEFPKASSWLEWGEEIRLGEERRFADALGLAAKAQAETGKLTESVRWLRKAIEVQPYQLSHRRALIETLLGQRSLAEAEEAIAEASRAFDDKESQSVLEGLEERLRILRQGTPKVEGPQGIRTEFVGRTSEFSSLASDWRAVHRGGSRVGLIKGSPGIGKTRLAEEIALLVDSEGGIVVTVKAVEVERSLEWGVITEIARSLHALPGAAGISNRSAAVLARLIPSLANVPGNVGTLAPPNTSEAAAVTDALLDLVGAVAEEEPIFLLVDDLQWVDKQSRAALSHLARALVSEPVFLLFTCRNGERDPEIEKATESLQRLPNATAAELGPLKADEVAELMALFLDGHEPDELDGFAQRIYAITRGNPLFVVEILKLLHSEGLLEWTGNGKWQLDPACLSGQLPVPETVESAIRRRLGELGEHARIIAAHLAEKARAIDTEDLRRYSGLDPFEVSEGIGQLFRHDLVHRTTEGRIEFVHDAVLAVARESVGSPPHRKKNGSTPQSFWRGVPGAVALVALCTIALAVAASPNDGPLARAWGVLHRSAPTYPYGEGQLFVRTTEGAFWVSPPARQGEAWTVRDTTISYPQRSLYGPFRMPDGSHSWFAAGRDSPEDPPYVGIPRPSGDVDPLWKIDGDAGFEDLSPDGRSVLLWEQILDAPQYAHRLLLLDLETRDSRRLYEGQTQMGDARWSPDGVRIALEPNTYEPSILLMNPAGGVLERFSLPEAREFRFLSWCPDSRNVAFTAVVDGKVAVGLIDTRTGEYEFIPSSIAGEGHVVCLGPASAVAFSGAAGTEPELLIHDLLADSSFAIPEFTGNRVGTLQWVPVRVSPVVRQLMVADRDIVMGWGERRQLAASGQLTDGTTRPIDVTWESADPTLASVDSAGMLTANSIGQTLVVATYGDWLEDTVTVTVSHGDPPAALFREDFSRDLSQWRAFGDPVPQLVRRDSKQVLALEGNGRYEDGLLGPDTLDLRGGATVELDFEFPLTRVDKQRIGVCLEHEEWDSPPLRDEEFGQRPDQSLCLKYPAGQFELFDSLEANVHYQHTGLTEVVHLPEDFSSATWTHLALQVRADGVVSVVANRQFVRQVGLRVAVDEDALWRVRLYGASVDTHLYVRNLVVWRGLRY